MPLALAALRSSTTPYGVQSCKGKNVDRDDRLVFKTLLLLDDRNSESLGELELACGCSFVKATIHRTPFDLHGVRCVASRARRDETDHLARNDSLAKTCISMAIYPLGRRGMRDRVGYHPKESSFYSGIVESCLPGVGPDGEISITLSALGMLTTAHGPSRLCSCC